MSRPSKRELRHNAGCVSIPNFFHQETRVMNSGCQCLPPDIFQQLLNIDHLTCDKIKTLHASKTDPHDVILRKMRQASTMQAYMVRNSNAALGMKHIKNNELVMVQSEQECEDVPHSEQILLNQYFRNDLQIIWK